MVERAEGAEGADSGALSGPPADPGGASLGLPTPYRLTDAALIPAWLVNLAALSWRVLAIAALGVVAALLAGLLWTVTASVAVAVVVAAVFAPFVLRLRDRGWTRTAAARAVWIASIVMAGVVLLLLAITFLPYLAQMLTLLGSGVATLQAQLADVQVPAFVGVMVQDATETASSAAGDAAAVLVASVAGAVTVFILAGFLVFFFLRDGDRAWVWMFQAIGDQKRERITTAGSDALARTGGYLRGTFVLSGLIAGTNLVFLIVLGVPLALPLAVLSFLAGSIPYFGGIITTIVVLLVTLAAQGTGTVVVLLGLMAVRTVVLASAVRPAVYGRTVNNHPALMLLVLPAVVLVEQAAQVGTTVIGGAGSVSAALDGHLDLSTQAAATAVALIIRVVASVGEGLVAISDVSVLSALLAFSFLRDGGHLWRRITRHAPDAVAPLVDAAGARRWRCWVATCSAPRPSRSWGRRASL